MKKYFILLKLNPFYFWNIRRNQELIQKLKTIFKGDTNKLDEFHSLSKAFRFGSISATLYYEHYLEMLGPHAQKLFKDLVDLLPEENKKRELLTAKEDYKAMVQDFFLFSFFFFLFSFPDANSYFLFLFPFSFFFISPKEDI